MRARGADGLRLSAALRKDDWVVLDALRKKRNVNDYAGDPIDTESLCECIVRAEALLTLTRQWIKDNHPMLLEDQE